MTNEELLKKNFANRHILQSKEWGEFKTLVGSRAVTANGLQLTTHKLPLGIGSVGYAPKVRPEDLDLEKLYEIGKKNNCIFVKLDVPHAPDNFQLSTINFQLKKGKPVFAQSTILMDLTKSDDELLAAMHEKTRYNIGLAQRKGVKVQIFENLEQAGAKAALENFLSLQKQTAQRQKFFLHPDDYYRKCFETLSSHQMAYLLEAKLSTINSQLSTSTAASWMLFRYGGILYYPYGESNYEFRSYMASNLLLWEAVQLGKKLGCKVFDLWGAADDPNDETNPWHGFTRFKLSFGGLHVKLAPTYDLVINKKIYNLFNLIDKLRWKLIRLTR